MILLEKMSIKIFILQDQQIIHYPIIKKFHTINNNNGTTRIYSFQINENTKKVIITISFIKKLAKLSFEFFPQKVISLIINVLL